MTRTASVLAGSAVSAARERARYTIVMRFPGWGEAIRNDPSGSSIRLDLEGKQSPPSLLAGPRMKAEFAEGANRFRKGLLCRLRLSVKLFLDNGSYAVCRSPQRGGQSELLCAPCPRQSNATRT